MIMDLKVTFGILLKHSLLNWWALQEFSVSFLFVHFLASNTTCESCR